MSDLKNPAKPTFLFGVTPPREGTTEEKVRIVTYCDCNGLFCRRLAKQLQNSLQEALCLQLMVL